MRVGIKFLHSDRRHWGVTYQEGLNVDPLPWNPTGHCQPGGLYFTTHEYAAVWATPDMHFVADVTVPSEYPVYEDKAEIERTATKWKAPALMLSNIRTVYDFLMEFSDQELRDFVKNARNPSVFYANHKPIYRRLLQLIPSEVICPTLTDFEGTLIAVKKMPSVLQQMRTRTFSNQELLQLVEVNPDCLMYFLHPKAGISDEVFKKAFELGDINLKRWVAYYQPAALVPK